MWKICSPSEASQCRTKPSATGVRGLGLDDARKLLRRRGRLGDTWYLDEVLVTFEGRRQYLWRAVDQDGDVLDILVQSRRDRRAAARFFRKVLQGQGRSPRRLVTDKLRRDSTAHRTVMPSVIHSTRQYANNRAAGSHQPTRQRERQMRRFKSAARAAVSRGPRTRAASLPGRATSTAVGAPPLASEAGVRRMGCGDGCLLNDEGYRAIEGSARPPLRRPYMSRRSFRPPRLRLGALGSLPSRAERSRGRESV